MFPLDIYAEVHSPGFAGPVLTSFNNRSFTLYTVRHLVELIPIQQSAHFFWLVCWCVLHFTKIPNTNKAHTLNQVILHICVAGLLTRCSPGTCDCGWCLVWGHAESPNDMPCIAMYLKYLRNWVCYRKCCALDPANKFLHSQSVTCSEQSTASCLHLPALIMFACLTDKMANLEPRRKENWRKGKLYKRWRGNIATFLLKSGGIETTIHEVPSVHDVCPLNSWQWK